METSCLLVSLSHFCYGKQNDEWNECKEYMNYCKVLHRKHFMGVRKELLLIF